MNKLIIGLLFSFVAFSGIQDNQIWVKAKMPFNIHAGDRFTIELTINKLDLQHFAELKQKLPQGFTAIEKQSGAAEFKFTGQTVTYTWLRLPRAPKIKISYDVVVDKTVKGSFNLPAQFTYIYKNQRGTAHLEQDIINVYAQGEKFTAKKEEVVSNVHFPPRNPSKVQCLRIKPVKLREHDGLIVKILVSSGNINGAAKIEEVIPPGYIAENIEGKGAAFVFGNGKVEYIWKKMPKQKNFEISYRLKRKNNPSQELNITGKLVYLSGGSLQTSNVIQVGSDFLKENKNEIDKDDVMNFFND